MQLFRRPRPTSVFIGLFVVILTIGGVAATRSPEGKDGGLTALQASGPNPSPPTPAVRVFIVPDDQLVPTRVIDRSAPPPVPQPSRKGPRSEALAKEIQPELPPSFRLMDSGDFDRSNAAVVMFEGPDGRIVINRQTLAEPLPTSAVVNMSLTPDVAPIRPPSYERRLDGTAIVMSQPEGSDATVAIARSDGEFVRLTIFGNPGTRLSVEPTKLRDLALRHLGLS